MTALEYIKDKFTGKTITIFDRKTMEEAVGSVTILSFDSNKKEVRFMEEGGSPEWDVLTGTYHLSLDKEEEIINFIISEANWDFKIVARYSTDEYLAVERF